MRSDADRENVTFVHRVSPDQKQPGNNRKRGLTRRTSALVHLYSSISDLQAPVLGGYRIHVPRFIRPRSPGHAVFFFSFSSPFFLFLLTSVAWNKILDDTDSRFDYYYFAPCFLSALRPRFGLYSR